MSSLSPLLAVSPIDGRYQSKTEVLQKWFSEQALFQYRLRVEIEYLIALSSVEELKFPKVQEADKERLRAIYLQFNSADAEQIKRIENVTNHDVKAVEYFLKEKIKGSIWEPKSEMIHFGLTSQDVNNTAVPLSIRECLNECYIPALEAFSEKIRQLAIDTKGLAMLARTHGQPASPTSFGKEMMVFADRLEKQLRLLKGQEIEAKFGGATGNFNAHRIAYPKQNWPLFADAFVREALGLQRQQYTTQIEQYDMLAALFDNMRRIHTILIDFSRDIWTYISMEYITQKIRKNEVGSSAMPHKVNPIDFENAEGNLGMANAVLSFLSEKLPVSRLQRDLTDSTVLRNVGVPFAHALISLASLEKGLSKLQINAAKMQEDLENNWLVVAEAYQTILRREGVEGAYEKLKEFTRTGQKQNATSLAGFIDSLPVNENIKAELRAITPHNYIGYAAE